MRIKTLIIAAAAVSAVYAQEYKVPVSEADEQMQKGSFEPTWESL